jgi:hypothetical protein
LPSGGPRTGAIPLFMLAFAFLLFPTGRPHTPRWRPAAWFVGGASALATVDAVVGATSVWSHPFITSFHQLGALALVALPYVLLFAALGGRLEVRSAPGQGTIITGCLPVPTASGNHQRREAALGQLCSGHSGNDLIMTACTPRLGRRAVRRSCGGAA